MSAAKAAAAGYVAGIRDTGDFGVRQLAVCRLVRPLPFNAARSSPGRRGSWRVSGEINGWREWAAHHADRAGLAPLTGPVHVDVHHLRINRSAMPDVGAPILAVKAVIDGLCDELDGVRVLPGGDGPDVVRRLTFHPPTVIGCDGLLVLITAAPGAEQTALDLTTEGTTAP